MMARPLLLSFGLLALGAAMMSCGGTPTGPTATPPVVADPGPVVVNTPPVIGKFIVQGTRINEPPNFADASEEIPVSVDVTDAESPVSSLKFNWTSNTGTFSGTGPKVTWRAPDKVELPVTVALNLEVVETYTSQGKPVTNNPKASVTVSLHDSTKEVGDMARQFLIDFSDTTIKDVSYVMRNFESGCYGTDAEASQVTSHIADYDMVRYTAGPAITTVRFGGTCPFRDLRGDACAQVRMHWESRAKHNLYWPSGDLYLAAGGIDTQDGVDQVAAMYYRDKQRWRLCDSAWDSDTYHTLTAVRSRIVFPSSVP